MALLQLPVTIACLLGNLTRLVIYVLDGDGDSESTFHDERLK